ncbi:MAG: endonuclease/exonuclease/phosphatase family protein [Acidobacteria bacterium]|nr:endonuclease/exonuclease/phosphatase family protein [Acidobacteriota bacterium]TDI50053.1 MAG: endonuclease/exonuclease/phosphatase family protein [Acidobacteriota bacterium]TDI55913.1 MAG: endonuclease/exonuclease/phosphatase family protein [Acidobacteriota bacterium]
MILVAIPAVALAAVSLAAFAGRWVWWLDILANFRAQYVVSLMILGLVVLTSKWRRIGYGILAVAAINLVFVLPLYAGSPGQADPDLPSLRVMSFNLLSTNESYSDVIEYIRAVDPDLVLLHEASRPWEVAIESANLDYEVIRPRSDELIFGTLVMVRGEEVEAISYGFAEGQPRAVSIMYRPTGWPEEINVLSTHALAPTEENRAQLRDAQLGFAATWAADQEGGFMVVGDFNATPWSWPFRNLMATAPLRNSQLGFGLQPSFPTSSIFLMRVPIDHLLHSDTLTVVDRHLGPAMGSDHFPLVVDLQLVPRDANASRS